MSRTFKDAPVRVLQRAGKPIKGVKAMPVHNHDLAGKPFYHYVNKKDENGELVYETIIRRSPDKYQVVYPNGYEYTVSEYQYFRYRSLPNPYPYSGGPSHIAKIIRIPGEEKKRIVPVRERVVAGYYPTQCNLSDHFNKDIDTPKEMCYYSYWGINPIKRGPFVI